jgi:pyruvate ferredoxin oxidoreductase beta subunit
MAGVKDSLLAPGHNTCAGCPIPIILRAILRVAGKNAIIVNATSCSEVTTTQYPLTSFGVNYIHCAFENAAAVASGVDAALKQKKQKANIIALAGDGGTFDIGLQALSGMVDRGDNVLFVCYDNECYANTGIQRSSATPLFASTTTSPAGKSSLGNLKLKKPLAKMLAIQGASYVATASLHNLFDLEAKVKKALSIQGPKFLHVLAPCPLSWRFPTSKTIEQARNTIESGIFPLYEIEKGNFRLTYKPKFSSVKDCLKSQGRFSHLTDKEIKQIEEQVRNNWKELLKGNIWFSD